MCPATFHDLWHKLNFSLSPYEGYVKAYPEGYLIHIGFEDKF